MNYTFTLLLLFRLSMSFGQSCDFTLSGKVSDEMGNPLVGATILLAKENKGEVADENGFFEFNKLCSGRYQIEVRFVGYKTISSSVKLTANKVWNVTLRSDSTALNEVVISEKHVELAATSTYSSLSG
ncbi:MAG: carboxypeptidase-like regulatory domain-containing protein, partial [Cyclobacteriaceae bacterium]|nr:carboxypeptidase-like regulatory domain-containing protein [Cyclobacteriaceae bacterium]